MKFFIPYNNIMKQNLSFTNADGEIVSDNINTYYPMLLQSAISDIDVEISEPFDNAEYALMFWSDDYFRLYDTIYFYLDPTNSHTYTQPTYVNVYPDDYHTYLDQVICDIYPVNIRQGLIATVEELSPNSAALKAEDEETSPNLNYFAAGFIIDIDDAYIKVDRSGTYNYNSNLASSVMTNKKGAIKVAGFASEGTTTDIQISIEFATAAMRNNIWNLFLYSQPHVWMMEDLTNSKTWHMIRIEQLDETEPVTGAYSFSFTAKEISHE